MYVYGTLAATVVYIYNVNNAISRSGRGGTHPSDQIFCSRFVNSRFRDHVLS
jgi:hypothetical protein